MDSALSYNFTNESEFRNHEAAVFTNNKALIQSFAAEFDCLWHQYAPAESTAVTSSAAQPPDSTEAKRPVRALISKKENPGGGGWTTGLFPILIGGGFGIRKWTDLAFDGAAGIPLPFFRDRQYVSYADRISYLDGNRLSRSQIGFGGWEVIAAPGHTEESVVFFNEASGELITGDLILGRKDGRGYVNRFCWDELQTRRTFAVLAATIRPRIIYPGHGPVIWAADDAFRKIDCSGGVSARDNSRKNCLGGSRNGLGGGRTGSRPRKRRR